MKKSLTMGLVTLTVLLNACKKTVEPSHFSAGSEPEYFQLPDEIADYTKLPANAYFIYQDSATGQLDSVVVRESRIDKTLGTVLPGSTLVASMPDLLKDIYRDVLVLKMTSETANGSEPWLTINYAADGSSAIDLVDEDPSLVSTSVFWYPVITRYLNTDEHSGYAIPFMDVEGTNYTDVYRFLFRNAMGSSDYYWAKGVGIIKRVLINNGETHTQTLIRKG